MLGSTPPSSPRGSVSITKTTEQKPLKRGDIPKLNLREVKRLEGEEVNYLYRDTTTRKINGKKLSEREVEIVSKTKIKEKNDQIKQTLNQSIAQKNIKGADELINIIKKETLRDRRLSNDLVQYLVTDTIPKLLNSNYWAFQVDGLWLLDLLRDESYLSDLGLEVINLQEQIYQIRDNTRNEAVYKNAIKLLNNLDLEGIYIPYNFDDFKNRAFISVENKTTEPSSSTPPQIEEKKEEAPKATELTLEPPVEVEMSTSEDLKLELDKNFNKYTDLLSEIENTETELQNLRDTHNIEKGVLETELETDLGTTAKSLYKEKETLDKEFKDLEQQLKSTQSMTSNISSILNSLDGMDKSQLARFGEPAEKMRTAFPKDLESKKIKIKELQEKIDALKEQSKALNNKLKQEINKITEVLPILENLKEVYNSKGNVIEPASVLETDEEIQNRELEEDLEQQMDLISKMENIEKGIQNLYIKYSIDSEINDIQEQINSAKQALEVAKATPTDQDKIHEIENDIKAYESFQKEKIQLEEELKFIKENFEKLELKLNPKEAINVKGLKEGIEDKIKLYTEKLRKEKETLGQESKDLQSLLTILKSDITSKQEDLETLDDFSEAEILEEYGQNKQEVKNELTQEIRSKQINVTESEKKQDILNQQSKVLTKITGLLENTEPNEAKIKKLFDKLEELKIAFNKVSITTDKEEIGEFDTLPLDTHRDVIDVILPASELGKPVEMSEAEKIEQAIQALNEKYEMPLELQEIKALKKEIIRINNEIKDIQIKIKSQTDENEIKDLKTQLRMLKSDRDINVEYLKERMSLEDKLRLIRENLRKVELAPKTKVTKEAIVARHLEQLGSNAEKMEIDLRELSEIYTQEKLRLRKEIEYYDESIRQIKSTKSPETLAYKQSLETYKQELKTKIEDLNKLYQAEAEKLGKQLEVTRQQYTKLAFQQIRGHKPS